jgi:hypothetical protein
VISIPLIRRHLMSDLLGRHIYLFGSGAAAGTVLRRLADAGAQEGTVVLAEVDDSRINAAALFRPVLALGAVSSFASIATLALAEAIESAAPAAAPAWPDRVTIADETAGTSAVEVATAGGRTDFVILGMSVDVRALEAAAGRPIEPNVLVAAWLDGLDRWSTAYAARGPAAVTQAIGFWSHGPGTPALEQHRSH